MASNSKNYHSRTGSVVVPHAHELPWVLKNGKVITVEGVVHEGGERFSINLLDGHDYETADVILHFNPRFDSDEIVLNSRQKGYWGEEQKGYNSFLPGSSYSIRIEVKEFAFYFMINGQPYAEAFAHHHLPLKEVSYLYLFGDTSVTDVIFEDEFNPVHRKPDVPFTTAIPKGLSPARCIFIKGVPRAGAKRFSVNLLCGPEPDSSDIALCLDIRFDFGDGYTVVRTSRVDGDWKSEETSDLKTFKEGVPFDISIMVKDTDYLIGNKNEHVASFEHRIPLDKVSHLHIKGDCDLTEVRFVEPAQ